MYKISALRTISIKPKRLICFNHFHPSADDCRIGTSVLLVFRENIKISSYNIIYEVLDFIKQKMSGLLTPDIKETITGTAQILEIFKVSGAGKVAGSKVTDGEISSASEVRIIRDGAIIYTGKVGTLFREKNQVKQVSNGQECGITVKDYMDFQKNDTIEAFNTISTERSI